MGMKKGRAVRPFAVNVCLVEDALDHIFYRHDEVGVTPDFFARRPANEPKRKEEDEMRADDGEPDG